MPRRPAADPRPTRGETRDHLRHPGSSSIIHLPDGRVLVLRHRYFHIFWILRLGLGSTYELATPTPHGWAHQPLPEAEAARLNGGVLPTPSLFDRFGMLLVVGGVVAVVALNVALAGAF